MPHEPFYAVGATLGRVPSYARAFQQQAFRVGDVVLAGSALPMQVVTVARVLGACRKKDRTHKMEWVRSPRTYNMLCFDAPFSHFPDKLLADAASDQTHLAITVER